VHGTRWSFFVVATVLSVDALWAAYVLVTDGYRGHHALIDILLQLSVAVLAVAAMVFLARNRSALAHSVSQGAQSKRLISAMEMHDTLMWELDPAGVITYMSPMVRELLGYAQEDLVGRHVGSLLSPDDFTRAEQLLAVSADTGRGWVDETYALTAKSGERVLIAWTGVTHVGARGVVQGFTGSLRRVGDEASESAQADAVRERIARVLDTRALHIVFQPIIDVTTGRVMGAEALSRFTSEPEQSPQQWFADAARVDLGTQLELLAVSEAMREASYLPDHVAVTINVSPHALLAPDAASLIRFAPRRGGRLIIEITEHVSVHDYDAVNAVMEPLRAGGIGLAVDDAGAGYASFQHILKLKPDYIKLDRSLIAGIDQDPDRAALVAALVTFAHKAASDVLAEGIETAAELAEIKDLGVRYAQGYYIGLPHPATSTWGLRSHQQNRVEH
jgi:PAS domain S-box-containing protein